MTLLESFLDELFGDVEGFIEVRVIEDQPRGDVITRRWYESVESLLADLATLNALAEERTAAIYFGVLPRRAQGCGTAAETLPGLVAWLDLDFKDFAGGESEARARLTAFPLAPSCIVRSGHGLHAYWHTREPAEPAALANLSRRLARALGGDHAHDAARVLRLPGTYNRKDGEVPLLVEIESLEPNRAWNASDLEEALEMVGAAEEAGDAPQADDSTVWTGPLDPRVRALLENRRVRALSEGRGKPEMGPDGRALDQSSSGYDYSLVVALAKAGLRDPALLANALWHRPDGAARAKGMRYIKRTVAEALERQEKLREAAPSASIDFEVERVRVFDSNPAAYEITIKGIKLTLDSRQLLSPSAFAQRFLDALGRIPRLPKRKEWPELVNSWLAMGERVEQPPDASEEHALREHIERAIRNLPLGEEAADLDEGRAVERDEKRIFKVDAILEKVQERHAKLTREQLCKVLRDLGYEPGSERLGREQVRAWSRP